VLTNPGGFVTTGHPAFGSPTSNLVCLLTTKIEETNMAIFHSSTKVITRSDGSNAVAAAAYRSGTRMTCARTGQVFNYTRKKEVTYRAILAPPNSPDWVAQRERLSNAIETVEKSRVNAQLWREVVLALPLALTPEQHIQLLTRYVQEQFVARGMVADVCHHHKKGNPHAHILLTLRDITPDGFGAKRRDWNDKALVVKWREAWATACNDALERAGSTERIDHRSNKDRCIDAPATQHLGRRTPWNAELYDDKAAANAWIQTSIELAKVQAEVKRVQSQIIDLTTSIAQALAERDSRHKSRPDSPPPGAVSAPTTPTAIWTPAGELRIAPVSAASLLRRGTSTRHQRPMAGATPSTHPATDLHSAPDSSKETKLC
jgi:hypothetical protein